MKRAFLLIACLAAVSAYGQKFDQLALTPPMGWNSWNRFACNVNEQLIRATADAIVTSGMRDAGYMYLNIDDCWHGQRDSLGFIHPDPARFPSGMKALADYVHSKGLKLGIYSDAGNKTCGGRPGSRGHEYQDALTYAQWGIDYLKYDWCETDGLNARGAYTTMRDALHAAGRPIVFSLCEWGNNKPWEWGKDVGHLWRTTTDIDRCWDGVVNHGTWSSQCVLRNLDQQKGLRQYAGPGHWNDPDMLEVGNGMSVTEDRAHFSLWAMVAAPLIAGNDVASMTRETAEILTNKRVIAIDQDSLGIQGFSYAVRDSLEIWFKPLVGDDWAMCVVNKGQKPQTFAFDWKQETVVDTLTARDAKFGSFTYELHDLWLNKEIGTTRRSLKTDIAGHDVLMLRLRRK